MFFQFFNKKTLLSEEQKCFFVACLIGFEPTTPGIGIRCSIQLSYRQLPENYSTEFKLCKLSLLKMYPFTSTQSVKKHPLRCFYLQILKKIAHSLCYDCMTCVVRMKAVGHVFFTYYRYVRLNSAYPVKIKDGE